ncbi:MAG: hypothetical protein HY220_02460 [Candidatus Sungbacteria bacterium]|uniref:Uncharacterized protein n=1 Tax=Candidatus Sungiibacteriota bacterium TaxID=2750080 RepID=A0A9D6LN79_9BACT|nr:hypothetical protein [Candidatus Sungbacteria bacterium]
MKRSQKNAENARLAIERARKQRYLANRVRRAGENRQMAIGAGSGKKKQK